jgi:selenocysteine-specific elongation factor
MRRLILGTAGHIDHGKTALVKALTGVDTDRLKEERERGITVDLGFAEYKPDDEVIFGVVDVPGHEGFIRNMVAGAAGMDLVLLVVAADEGVMPQTKEHVSIVRLLGVPLLAVAVAKADLVDSEWLELVREDVQELLRGTPYEAAPIQPVSSLSGEGMVELGRILAKLGLEAEEKGRADTPRLPVDRVFTIKGAGTVVTGTLWSGELRQGEVVRILPGDLEARVRSVQLHGSEVESAQAGARAAIGLTGRGFGHQDIKRGQAVVGGPGWEASWMLTCHLTLLDQTGWELEQNQRVKVHLGTSEVLARVAILEGDRIGGGGEGWVQLRLEEPVLARTRDHLVIRSYSPVTTIGGGRVAEVSPRKRRRLSQEEKELLGARLGDSVEEAVEALLETCGWEGVFTDRLPQRTGFPSDSLTGAVEQLRGRGALIRVEQVLFSGDIWNSGRDQIISRLEEYHRLKPLRPGAPLEEVRQVVPGGHGPKIADALLQDMASREEVVSRAGVVARWGFEPALSEAQENLRSRLKETLSTAGLTPPDIKALEGMEADQGDVEGILRLMETEGEVVNIDGVFFFHRTAILEAGRAVVAALGGEMDLGPADFKEVLPVSRRHLLPILRYFDLTGVTTRKGDGREVASALPADWGTLESPVK